MKPACSDHQVVRANQERGAIAHKTRVISLNAKQIREDANEVLQLAQQYDEPVEIESGPAAGVTIHPDGRGIVDYIFAHEEALV